MAIKITTPVISRPAKGLTSSVKSAPAKLPGKRPAVGVKPGVATRTAKGASAKATAGTNALLDNLSRGQPVAAGARSGVGRAQANSRKIPPIRIA